MPYEKICAVQYFCNFTEIRQISLYVLQTFNVVRPFLVSDKISVTPVQTVLSFYGPYDTFTLSVCAKNKF
jgi:hypothetical protein